MDMVTIWLIRILPILAVLVLYILDDFIDPLFPQSFVVWKETNMIEFLIMAALFWWGCYTTVLWLQGRSELKSLHSPNFNMKAPDAARYIQKHLKIDSQQCNMWVTEKVTGKELELMGFKPGEVIPELVNIESLEFHESVEINLIGGDNQRRLYEEFGSAFDENGWIEVIPSSGLTNDPLYRDLRFSKKQIKEIVCLYKKVKFNK